MCSGGERTAISGSSGTVATGTGRRIWGAVSSDDLPRQVSTAPATSTSSGEARTIALGQGVHAGWVAAGLRAEFGEGHLGSVRRSSRRRAGRRVPRGPDDRLWEIDNKGGQWNERRTGMAGAWALLRASQSMRAATSTLSGRARINVSPARPTPPRPASGIRPNRSTAGGSDHRQPSQSMPTERKTSSGAAPAVACSRRGTSMIAGTARAVRRVPVASPGAGVDAASKQTLGRQSPARRALATLCSDRRRARRVECRPTRRWPAGSSLLSARSQPSTSR